MRASLSMTRGQSRDSGLAGLGSSEGVLRMGQSVFDSCRYLHSLLFLFVLVKGVGRTVWDLDMGLGSRSLRIVRENDGTEGLEGGAK